ncbi:MAG: hypothetical protein J6O71_01715 [Lachnospiraceae bacterium]|nr:hypothetical protein [Lachnospiraceae bacterium]
MVFISPKMSYEVTATRFNGEVNDCFVAKVQDEKNKSLYTLIVIHDHDTVRTLLDIFRKSISKEGPFIESFSSGQDYVLVFPYRTERLLDDFFEGEGLTLEQCEEISTNLILSCIASYLPYPVLYLIITQGKLNLSRDNSIYLTFDIDLKDLDEHIRESDCATECANIILKVLESKINEKNISYELLSKKTGNRSYSKFTEIYRDIKIASTPVKKRNIIVRIKSFFHRNADRLFGILFWVCLILGIIALVMLLTHLVWGDIPFLRIFFNSFKTIGTESLLK